MKMRILVSLLLLLSIVHGQEAEVKIYDWRLPGGQIQEWPRGRPLAYQNHAPKESYPVKEDLRQYPNDPSPYVDSSYSGEYQNLPYQSISTSYDSYGNAPYQEEFNMTKERIGGFAGSGDTRGYGAYDFPKNHHPESVEHLEIEPFSGHEDLHPPLRHELSDLLRIGRNHHTRNPDPMLIHPLPPPL
ncbi:uncharacterized protein CDAR_51771 [Caerostris darwini]|uniref:Uncharacterized protein n=1 Tax=Caerostris darwini TaxID=1538125 RepID=A0AAV4V828_9ARAC|nr:uncharacterized protein CDAR_51771 [Caerostris darwini]